MDYKTAKKLNPSDIILKKEDNSKLIIQSVIPWKTLNQHKKVIILECLDENQNFVRLTHLDVNIIDNCQ